MEDLLMTELMWTLLLFFALGTFIIAISFYVTLYIAMNKVPEEKRYFPSWFVWMMLVPIAGFVFAWMMLPWGIPRTLKNGVAGNIEAEKRADTLFGLGLAFSILVTLCLIPYINILFIVPTIVLWIIYWVKVAKFSKKYLPRKSDQQN